jgi:hypothetical protein
VLHFGGVDIMAKKKIQRDAESGNEILNYIQKLKNDFIEGCQKCSQSKKLPKRKEKSTRMTNRKLRSKIE